METIEGATATEDSAFGSGQGGVVVRVVGDFRDVLDVRQFAFRVDDEDGSREAAVEWATVNEDSVVVAEFRATMRAERLHRFHALGSAPTLRAEGKVHTDNQNFGIGESLSFVVEPLRFGMAGRRIERRDRGNDSRLARAAGQRDIG